MRYWERIGLNYTQQATNSLLKLDITEKILLKKTFIKN